MATNRKTGRRLKVSGCGRLDVAHGLKFGFTLIELLVVVSIIAVLVAILLPALGEARNQAHRVVCKAQLHQVGIGIVMYASDNNDKLSVGNFFNYPIANPGDSNGNGVPNEPTDNFVGTDLQPYLSEDLSIFLCPANKLVARMPAYSVGTPAGMSTYEWYQSGHFNNFGAGDNWSNYIYYLYFGNYHWETSNYLLSYQELQLRDKGFIYPKDIVGPRAKVMQDMVTDENDIWSFGYNESHEHPNGLYTDGSVDALIRSELEPHARPMGVTVVWYW